MTSSFRPHFVKSPACMKISPVINGKTHIFTLFEYWTANITEIWLTTREHRNRSTTIGYIEFNMRCQWMRITHTNDAHFIVGHGWIRWLHRDFYQTLWLWYLSPCCRWIVGELMHFNRHWAKFEAKNSRYSLLNWAKIWKKCHKIATFRTKLVVAVAAMDRTMPNVLLFRPYHQNIDINKDVECVEMSICVMSKQSLVVWPMVAPLKHVFLRRNLYNALYLNS